MHTVRLPGFAAGDYSQEVAEDEAVLARCAAIRAAAAATEARADAFRARFGHLAHLWTTPLQASLQVRACSIHSGWSGAHGAACETLDEVGSRRPCGWGCSQLPALGCHPHPRQQA